MQVLAELREVRYNKLQITVSVGFLVRYTHLTDKCMLVLALVL